MKNKTILYVSTLVFFTAILLFTGAASAKSLYVIADINSSPTPIQAFDIQGTELVYQQTQYIPYYGGGAVGIAIDTESEVLFVTYEFEDVIQLIDATTFEDLGYTTAPGASNLAGIVKDQDKGLIYTNDRYTADLYIYEHNPVTHALTLQDQIVMPNCHEAYGIALDEMNDLLYVADTWYDYGMYEYVGLVHVYDTDTWTEVDSFEPCQPPISVAVDVANGYVYTGSGWWGGTGDNLLCQYDLVAETSQSMVVDDTNPYIGIIGVAIDPATSLVYCTTGYQGDDVRVYDSTLTELFVTEPVGGDPTGLVVPGRDISLNPLNLHKEDNIEGECVSRGQQFTYTICFDNLLQEIDVHDVELIDLLPPEVDFVSASDEGVYDSVEHEVYWCFCEIPAGAEEYCVTITVEVNTDAVPGELITNYVTIDSDETPPTTQSAETLICEQGEDDTPPVTIKTIGDPKYNDGEWVTTATEITLTATDPGEGATGVKEIHYIIDEGEEIIVECDGVSFTFPSECEHTIEFWAVDNALNEEEHTIQTHYVDDTGPEQTIAFGNPKDEQFYMYQGDWYIGISGHTPIWINSTDLGCDDGGVGSDYLEYEIYWGEVFGVWTFQEAGIVYDNDPHDINPTVGEITVELFMDESCWHEVHYWCYDLLGNRQPANPGSYHNIDFIVDADAPETTWEYEGPSYVDDQDRVYISCDTMKIIHATDSGCIPGGIGVCYMDWWVDKKIGPDEWEIVDSGRVYDNDDNDLDDTIGEIEIAVMIGESCEHHIYHQAVDCFGTAGPEYKQYVRVDCTPPETTKTIGEPICGEGYWVTTSTEITLTAVDYMEPCMVGVYYIYYEIWWDSDSDGTVDQMVDHDTVYDDTTTFTFDEECLHEIRWYAVDMLFNMEEMQTQQHRVDDTPPVTTKTIGTPQFCGGEWVTTSTEITLTAVDHCEPCAVGVTQLHYEIWWDSTDDGVVDTKLIDETLMDDHVTFTFTEECLHEIRWYAVDCLGNTEEEHTQTHYVDDTPPDIIKTVGDPNCTIIPGEEYCVSFDTLICFSAEDQGCMGGVGMQLLEYRTWYQDQWSDWEPIDPYWGTCITFIEECTHILEIHAMDYLGNDYTDSETFHVDNTPPEVVKTVGDPQIYIGFDIDYWVSCETPITIDARDSGCCGQIEYVGYQINDTGWVNITDSYPVDIFMPGDCFHVLDIKVVDCLGHETIDTERFYVDCTPPESWKFICADYYASATQEDIDKFGLVGEEITYFWLTNTSEICINAEDIGTAPCISGLDYIHIELWWDEDGDDIIDTMVWERDVEESQYCFTINESCLHKIIWYGVDLLGNAEEPHIQYHRVDKDPPETEKRVGEPKWWDDDEGLWWVTSDTTFSLVAQDATVPCAIGVDYLMVKLKHSCDGESWSTYMGWTQIFDNDYGDLDPTPGVIQFNFTLPYECYWKIKWYAVDLFGYSEELHIQYHLVDNTPPHVIILKPTDGWYSDGSVIPSVVLSEDFMSPHGYCPPCSGCAVGIEDGAQGKAWFIDVFPDFDIIELETPNFLYDADSHEYIGNLRIPEETGIPDGVVLLVVGAEDRLGNNWNSMFELLHAYFIQALASGSPIEFFADCIADFIADQNIVWIGMDNTDPLVNFLEPQDGDEIGPNTVFISAEMEDVLSGIQSGTPCFVTLDGVSIGTLAYSSSTGLCEGILSIAGFPSKQDVPLSITVHDLAGNGGSDTVIVDVDNAQVGSTPIVHILTPENATSHEGMLTVHIYASDAETSPEDLLVNLWVSRQYDPDFVYEATYDDVNDYFVVTIDISSYQEGAQLRLQAEATDEDMNTGVSASIIVFVSSDVIYDQWMVEGWNLINLPEICGDDEVASVLYSIDGFYAIVFEVGTWHSYIPSEPINSLEVITPGNWYWVYMDGASARFYYECVES